MSRGDAYFLRLTSTLKGVVENLREKGIDFDLEMVPFEMKTLYEPKHPEVLRVNPKRQVPVLIDGDLELFDSTQIFEYLETVKPDPALWPTDAKARARARLLEHKSDEVYFPHIVRLMGDPKAPGAHEAAARFYDEMERTLGDQEWLGGSYSYADIAFYMAQLFGDRMGAGPPVRQVAGAMGRYLLSIGRKLPAFLARISTEP